MAPNKKTVDYQLAKLPPAAQKWKDRAKASASMALVLSFGCICIFFDIGRGSIFYFAIGTVAIFVAASWYSSRRLLALVPRTLLDQSNRRVLPPTGYPRAGFERLDIQVQVEKLPNLSKWFPIAFLGVWCCGVLLFDYLTVAKGIPGDTDFSQNSFLVVLTLFNVFSLFICFKLIPQYILMMKISELPEASRLIVTPESLQVPLALLGLFSLTRNADRKPYWVLPWSDITGWAVVSNSEDEGAHYLISLKSQPDIRVYRSGLKSYEKQILDYARSVGGIAITLQTNLDHEDSR
jgi:hypothetical protein